MKKKTYIIPLSEVTQLGPDVIMEAFGPASTPADPFNAAPARKHGGNSEAPVF